MPDGELQEAGKIQILVIGAGDFFFGKRNGRFGNFLRFDLQKGDGEEARSEVKRAEAQIEKADIGLEIAVEGP